MASKRAMVVKKESERHVQFQVASSSTSPAPRPHRTGAEVASSSTSRAPQHRTGAEVTSSSTPRAPQHRTGAEVASSLTPRAPQHRTGAEVASSSTPRAPQHRTGAEVASSSTSRAPQHRTGAEVTSSSTPRAPQHRTGAEVASSGTSRAPQHRTGAEVTSSSTPRAPKHRTGVEVPSSSTPRAPQHRTGAEVASSSTSRAPQHRTGAEVASSSTTGALQHRTGVDFGRNFQVDAKLRDGTRLLADYNINKPTRGQAYFNMLLDASGSMFHRHAGLNGRGERYVYEHLFECYEDLVTSGEALRPDDIICVWLFNKRTKLLCEVEVRNFHKKKGQIKKDYEKELDNRSETRLYDAVAHVMDTKIRAVWSENKKADFFLVVFTDGRDRNTGKTSLNAMMDNLMELNGRLHTFFITVNLPTDAPLYTRLVRQNEVQLVHCESTQPSDISCAFNQVRNLIKAVLVLVAMRRSDAAPKLTRVVEFGESKEAIAKQMMDTLSKGMSKTSLIELYNHGMKPVRQITN